MRKLFFTSWNRTVIGNTPLYQASTISNLPSIIQAFTTRLGGVGAAPYDSLNLSERCGDDARAVAANRSRVTSALGFDSAQMVFAEQVHGARVAVVNHPFQAPVAGVDAIVTDTPGVVLTLFFADCYPIYFIEPLRRVVALAHSGWRGTAGNIAQKTADVLADRFDVSPRTCLVAIGPGIAARHYVVDTDVADHFRDTKISISTTAVLPSSEMTGKWELNLRAIIFAQLLAAGFRAESIAVCEEDTFQNKRDFFSYRRESMAGRATGRMAAILGLRDPG